jgi:hypothetical protein
MKYSDSRKIMSDISKAWSRREWIGVGVAGFGTLWVERGIAAV